MFKFGSRTNVKYLNLAWVWTKPINDVRAQAYQKF